MEQQRLGYQFEKFVKTLFERFKFDVEQDDARIGPPDRRRRADLIVTKDNTVTLIEVKFYRDDKVSYSQIEQAVANLLVLMRIMNDSQKGLIVVSTYVSSIYKLQIKQKLGIVVWDRTDLYHLIKEGLKDEKLLEEFEHLLLQGKQGLDIQDVFDKIESSDKSTGDYFADLNTSIPQPSNILPNNRGNQLCAELNAIAPGRPGWSDYEKKCIEILKYIFDKELANWNVQNSTDDELSRFDMVCGIIQQTGFWGTLIQSFQSRYVLFEFKNYTDPIGQDQVYTTERYLYLKGLRSVGFIISRNGAKPQATKACKGALREHGKLILILDNSDLCKMLMMKDNGDNPSDHLSGILDEFLISLSR